MLEYMFERAVTGRRRRDGAERRRASSARRSAAIRAREASFYARGIRLDLERAMLDPDAHQSTEPPAATFEEFEDRARRARQVYLDHATARAKRAARPAGRRASLVQLRPTTFTEAARMRDLAHLALTVLAGVVDATHAPLTSSPSRPDTSDYQPESGPSTPHAAVISLTAAPCAPNATRTAAAA